MSELSEGVEVDTTSWKEIEVTVYVTAVTSLLFLLVFEVMRRRPAFGAVYDRRRRYYAASNSSTAATTTTTTTSRNPPPLLQTRWLEWLFLSTDPAYTAYADFVHQKDVLQERRRQQDEWNETRQQRSLKRNLPTVDPILDDEDEDEEEEDDMILPVSMTSLEPGAEGGQGGEMVLAAQPKMKNANANSNGKEQGGGARKRTRKTNTHSLLTPDVLVVNGRRLHASSVEELDIFNDTVTDEQLEALEQKLLEMESNQEQQFRERHHTMLLEQQQQRRNNWWGRPSTETTSQSRSMHPTNGDVEQAGDDLLFDDIFDLSQVHAPARWKYLGLHRRLDFSGAVHYGASSSEQATGTRGVMYSATASTGESYEAEEDDDGRATSRTIATASGDSDKYEYRAVNQYLKGVSNKMLRPLSRADQELLRCVGLDAFVMLRFLRFGFDVTFYPFLVACIMLIPTYYTNDYFDDTTVTTADKDDEFLILDTSGYFQFTFTRLEPDSPLLWVAWAYAMLFFSFCLWRIWIEWETFIALRFDFLAHGDAEMDSGFSDQKGGSDKKATTTTSTQLATNLHQYRNTCLVEYVPGTHRSDQELFEFFDAIFPNQVQRAEILMEADSLTRLIAKRQTYLELYEDMYAKYFHAHQKHRRRIEHLEDTDGGLCHYFCFRCCRGLPQPPSEPTMNVGGIFCYRKLEKTLSHYLTKIHSLNDEIETEHCRITDAKQNVDDSAKKRNVLSRTLGKGVQYVTGTGFEYTCDTGFVEFKNLSTKQNAIQCNIAGTTHFMTTASAPDPRDINWGNAGVTRRAIAVKRHKCEVLLFVGTLFWFFVVALVTSISNLDRLDDYLPSWLIPEQDTYLYGLIQGYLPIVVLELLMLVVPFTLRIVATRYIRLKTKSEVEKFVFVWHVAYRLANLITIMVKNQVYQSLTVDSVTDDFRGTANTVAEGIAVSSQFFLNNMIYAAGTETMWELAQMPSLIVHFFTYRVVTVEAKSKRTLERLERPGTFEWGDVFPPFIFAFLVAAVFCTIVPLVLGACAVFFYLATKVFTHQALFVYAQPYEGGGKLMYLLNRTIFVILYISIAIFAMLLGLKEAKYQAPSFFVSMTLLTLLVDWRIQTKFVAPSISLNLTDARVMDNESQCEEERIRRGPAGKGPQCTNGDDDKPKAKEDGVDYDSFLYRQPQLNKSLWETKPRTYR